VGVATPRWRGAIVSACRSRVWTVERTRASDTQGERERHASSVRVRTGRVCFAGVAGSRCHCNLRALQARVCGVAAGASELLLRARESVRRVLGGPGGGAEVPGCGLAVIATVLVCVGGLRLAVAPVVVGQQPRRWHCCHDGGDGGLGRGAMPALPPESAANGTRSWADHAPARRVRCD
jgi:hypothetical protein